MSKYFDVPSIESEDGYVYWIQDEQSYEIKIGHTFGVVKDRLKYLQIANCHKLHLLAWIEASRDVEQSWHKRLQHQRTNGEWFKPTIDVLQSVGASC